MTILASARFSRDPISFSVHLLLATVHSNARRVEVVQMIVLREGISMLARMGGDHIVKMIHNGIKYGLMQAYVKGFDTIKMNAARVHQQTSFSISNLSISLRPGRAGHYFLVATGSRRDSSNR
ncbi:MAG: hypothetical protein EOO38_18065 [Cytophagaceae bacterium]|nr:MAG: hypothetical protein EOO38_18065 [Cytophagaceae bacterium]